MKIRGLGNLKQAFIVYLDVPEGVEESEVMGHLTDAHRRAVSAYHESDPIREMTEIEVAAFSAGVSLVA